MLQRSFEEDEDEQDEELGMDTYHVEWCGQKRPRYGGIERFVLKRTGAEVTFKPEAVEDIDELKQMSIAFDLSAGEYEELKAALTNIFAGESCFEMSDGQAIGAHRRDERSPSAGCTIKGRTDATQP
jgi:hypothetical protein